MRVNFWDPDYYKSIHADWKTNGKGHRAGYVEGQYGILVSGAPIKKIKRRRGVEAALDTVEDDGAVKFEDGDMEKLLDAAAEGFAIPKAVGAFAGGPGSLGWPAGGLPGGRREDPGSAQGEAKHQALGQAEPGSSGSSAQPPATSMQSTNPFGFSFTDAAASATCATQQEGAEDRHGRKGNGNKATAKTKAKPSTPRKTTDLSSDGTPQSGKKGVGSSPYGGGGGGGAGRKPNGNMMMARQQAEMFELSTPEDNTCYGGGSKAHKSFLKRIKDGVEAKQQQELDPSNLHEMIVAFKRLTVVTDLTDTFLKHGFQSSIFISVFDAKLNFMEMPPKVEHPPIPRFMRMAHNDHKATYAVIAREFWVRVADDVLTKLGLMPERFVDERTRLVKLRVIFLTKKEAEVGSVVALLQLSRDHDKIIDKSGIPGERDSLYVLARACLRKDM